MSYKLFIISNNNKLLKFNEDDNYIIETNILQHDVGSITFEDIQLFLIVEYKIDEYCFYINPYTGKYLFSEGLSTENSIDAAHHWIKFGKEWILNNNDHIRINITLINLTIESIRIIWSNLGIINSQIPLKHYIMLENGLVVHDSYHNIDSEVDKIISAEWEQIQKVPADRLIILTSGSQAAGKSHFFNYERGSNESIANYETKKYYNKMYFFFT